MQSSSTPRKKFGITRLEEHAASLAQSQVVTDKPLLRRSLVTRLSNNEAVLLDAYRSIVICALKLASFFCGEKQAICPSRI